MGDAAFSTTKPACDPVKGCPCSCDRGWQEVQDEVNQALRPWTALGRNKEITAAYRLASYIWVQGGCAMKRVALARGLAGVNAPLWPGKLFFRAINQHSHLKKLHTQGSGIYRGAEYS